MSLDDINLLDLDRFQRLEHHEMFKRLREEAPVYWHDHPEGKGFWNIVQHADLVKVNRDTATFSSEAGGVSIPDPSEQSSGGMDPRGLMMLYMDPPKHTRYRTLVQKGFTPRMIGLLEQYLTHRAILIVDNVIERGSCDFVTDLASELPLQAIAEIMGVPQEERNLLFDWSNRMIVLDDPEYAGDKNDGATASAELYMYVNQLAKQRETDPRDDIVTKLINAEIDGDKLSEIEFDMFMLLLTVAGNETTRNGISHGMLALIDHPGEWARLKADPSLVDSAVEEMLRWGSPVLNFRRTATCDVELHGTQIKEGDAVVMFYASANRDEDVFSDPFTFDITRSPNPHLTFGGGGPHFCLGANLARMEMRILFQEIARQVGTIEQTGPITRLRSSFVHGIKSLPMRLAPA